jgi:hypothetical protein
VDSNRDKAVDRTRVTSEVASEGGSPGDVEVDVHDAGTGSEATETWQPADEHREEVLRDERGEGRRSP